MDVSVVISYGGGVLSVTDHDVDYSIYYPLMISKGASAVLHHTPLVVKIFRVVLVFLVFILVYSIEASNGFFMYRVVYYGFLS